MDADYEEDASTCAYNTTRVALIVLFEQILGFVLRPRESVGVSQRQTRVTLVKNPMMMQFFTFNNTPVLSVTVLISAEEPKKDASEHAT